MNLGEDQQYPFSTAIEQLDIHEHACLLYETREEQFAAMVPFTRTGLERGEKCIYSANDNTLDEVHAALSAGGIDVDEACATGRLLMFTHEDTYLRDTDFDPDRMIVFLAQVAANAKREGFSTIRMTGEMTWALGDNPGVERLMEYEAKLNDFSAKHPIIIICQFNLNRFSPAVIHDAILTHPIVISRNTVSRNFYYVPPDEFLQPRNTTREVKRLLTTMVERERAERAVQASESRFREIFENSLNCLCLLEVAGDGSFCNLETNPAFESSLGISRTELVGTNAEERPTEDISHTIIAACHGCLEAGSTIEDELTLELPDGCRVFHATVVPIRNTRGSVYRILGILRDITEQKRAEEMLNAKQQQLAAMVIELSLAEERERRRIAAELHDHIGQILLLGKMKLGTIVGSFTSPRDEATYNEVQQLFEQAIHGIRSLTQQLNPPQLGGAGLEAALEWLGRQVKQDYGLSVEFSDDKSSKPLSEEIRSIVYQSARELLINVAKHAGVTAAQLDIARQNDMLCLTVADRGIGLDYRDILQSAPKEGCFGLFNIQQRIKHLGGEVTVKSSRHQGTCITILAPLDKLPHVPATSSRSNFRGA